MENEAAVAHVRWCIWHEGDVVIGIVGAESWESGNGAMFAAEVADLACLRLRVVTWRGLTTGVRVEMGEGSRTVAVTGNVLIVDVVD